MVFLVVVSFFWSHLALARHLVYSFGVHKFYKTKRTPASDRLPRDALHAGFYFISCIHLVMLISPFEGSLILRVVDPFFVVFARRYIRMHAQNASMPKWMTQSLSLPLYLSLAYILMQLLTEHGMLFLKTWMSPDSAIFVCNFQIRMC